jgi:hypothetical protein
MVGDWHEDGTVVLTFVEMRSLCVTEGGLNEWACWGKPFTILFRDFAGCFLLTVADPDAITETRRSEALELVFDNCREIG